MNTFKIIKDRQKNMDEEQESIFKSIFENESNRIVKIELKTRHVGQTTNKAHMKKLLVNWKRGLKNCQKPTKKDKEKKNIRGYKAQGLY